jgi:disulfide bond formation protein DsbB
MTLNPAMPMPALGLAPIRPALLIMLGSGGLLLGALAFQHIGKLAPCAMCYWQRYGHVAALGIAWLALWPMPQAVRRAVLTLAGLALLVTAGLALYHLGVEWKWWPGPQSCTTGGGFGGTIDELKRRIMQTPIVRCDAIAWSMWGLSMAGWNSLISLLLGVGALSLTWKR